ncbi:MAG: sulfatase [Pirellulales bacterium]
MPTPLRHYLLFLSTVVALCSSYPAALAAKEARPNVVVFLIDDMGWTDLGCQGSTYYETPHIDQLAADGIRFTNGYAACAVCSPTRAAMMTGKYPARVGVTDWIRAEFQGGKMPASGKNPTEYVGGKNNKLLCPPNPLWMEHEEFTLAEVMKAKGYKTCYIGKWHLGMEAWYPESQGFDFNYGGCDYGQPPSYFDPYKNGRLTGIPTLKPRKEGEYLTDREADEAVGFIEKHKDQPFFLYVANYAVHTPIQAKKKLIAKYNEKPKTNQKNAAYAAMVESVDDSVGAVLDCLERNQLTEKTLVLFTSDNGGLLGPTHNAPLRSGKGNPYEGGIRVPFIVKWPGHIKPGSVSDSPVCSIDVLPTLVDIVEPPLPSNLVVDGVSLLDELTGKQKIDSRLLFWHFPHYRSKTIPPYAIVRDGNYKLIHWFEGKSELYDLEKDLSETTDLATQFPEIKLKMLEQLEQLLIKNQAKVPRKNPGYLAN